MRTIIYGAGGIGSAIGGSLARAGQEVILIGSTGHVRAINENGLKLTTPAGIHILHIPAVTAPGQIEFRPDDVVFLTMQSQRTEEAVKTLKSCVENIPVFCIQNGVRNEETAAHQFENVYGVTVGIGTVFLNDGEVTARMDPAGWLIMGTYPTGTDAVVEAVAEQCRAARLIVRVTPEIMRYKWGRILNNLRNAVGAITNAGRSDCAELSDLAKNELTALLDEAGMPYATSPQITKQWPELSTDVPQFMAGEAQSSTWQSLARRSGSVETEFFNGEAVRLARKLGKPAPINEGLNRIVQEMAVKRETPGKYSVTELKELLSISSQNS